MQVRDLESLTINRTTPYAWDGGFQVEDFSKNLGVGVVSFTKSSRFSCVTGFPAVLNTEPLTEETGYVPCNNQVEAVDSFGAAGFPKTSPAAPSFVCQVVGCGRG